MNAKIVIMIIWVMGNMATPIVSNGDSPTLPAESVTLVLNW